MSLIEQGARRDLAEGEQPVDLSWPRTVGLPDGADVLVRPLEASDAPQLAAAIARMSPESRYRRFLSPVPKLTAAHLRYLTDIDHHDREALVAFDPSSGRGLGVARWGVFVDDPTIAEVAVAVADDAQRRGLATALLGLLMKRAESEDLHEIRAATLRDNRAAVRLLERFGFRRLRSEGAVAEFALALRDRRSGDRAPGQEPFRAGGARRYESTASTRRLASAVSPSPSLAKMLVTCFSTAP